MNNPLEITIAQASDIPALCQLLESLFNQEAEFSPNREKQQRGLLKIMDNPELGFILVGKLDSAVIGMVNILFTVSTALGERVALLEDMVIAETYQNRGLGKALIEKAIAEARNQHCKRITLLTDKSNEAAQRFYQQHGFVQSTMMPLRLMLD